MIESNIIKRFIVKTFMQNSESDVPKIAEMVMDSLSTRFMPNEHVFVPSKNLSGKICGCSKTAYKVATPDSSTVEVPFGEISRKFKVDFHSVCCFLECITMVTPLGRIVIENVFDKISQPGFGARRMYMEPSPNRHSPRGMPFKCREPVFPAGAPFQQTEIRSPRDRSAQTVEPAGEPESPELDFGVLKPYSLSGLEGEELANIIRIYTFFSTFGRCLKMEKFTAEEMVSALKDPEYSSKISLDIHASLVGMIEKDIKVHGSRFLNELNVLAENLPAFQVEPAFQQNKKRVPFDIENWKSQTKIFIQNLSRDLDLDKVLRFMDFAKKDNIGLRIEFICFLLDVVSFTESMREFVSISQNQIRLEKSKIDQLQLLRRRTDSEAKAELEKLTIELDSISLKNINSPLRAHIGRYKNYLLLLVSGSIILKDRLSFFLVGSAEALAILKDLDTSNKIEKSTSVNLRGIVEVLFKS